MSARKAKSDEAPAKRAKKAEDATVPRERILHAAAKLFGAHGYKGTTVRNIADAAGILSGSLFHHFRSKEEMLLEIMREAAMSVCIRSEEAVIQSAAPREQLRRLVRIGLEYTTDDFRRDYQVVLFFEWREVPEAAKPEFTRLRKRYQKAWIKALSACDEQGILRAPPDASAHVLQGAVRDAMVWFKPGGKYSRDEFTDMMLRLVLD